VAGAVKKPATPKSNKLPVTCPHCGHKQLEPPAAYSTVCKSCGQHFRVQDASKPAAVKAAPARKGGRQVTCFKCNTELDVSPTAQSTMCKRCSSHMDLRDYSITNATSRNFETKGRFTIEQGAYLFNTDTTATHVILKGRVLGKLTAEDSLEIYSTAELKGSFKARKLVIPAGQRFRWPEALTLHGAEIAGELVANIKGGHTIVLRSTARLFGNVESQNIVIEPGAIIEGEMKITPPVRPSISNVPV
jgi:cytoskeletal protein CcmA (bactofilin family)/DNA-directed RNA polymerase subunit RPC12/RpoP